MDKDMTDELNAPEGELTRLADGSLPAGREAELRAQIRQSPELTAALAEQERAVSMLRTLDEPAPAALRARLDELTGTTTWRRAPRWRRVSYGTLGDLITSMAAAQAACRLQALLNVLPPPVCMIR